MHFKETCSQLCSEILPLLSTECQRYNEEILTSEIKKRQNKALSIEKAAATTIIITVTIKQ